jgi:hypothetical protein
VDDRFRDRIERAAGVPGLVEVLADELALTDLQSLLLAVYRRRAATITPAQLLAHYERSRAAAPSPLDPATLLAFDQLAGGVLRSCGYQGVELSPVNPLGAVAALTGLDQNQVLSTVRGTEVVADSTNALALECAVRRRALLRRDPRDGQPVRLFSSHRMLRGQAPDLPGVWPHFRLLGLVTAGRDAGSFGFETSGLADQIGALLRILAEAGDALGYRIGEPAVTVTELSGGQRRDALYERVLAPLAHRFPGVGFAFDDERTSGRGYYTDACFHIHATSLAGTRFQLADGGFTTWTRQLLGNAKERLLIGGLGVERLCAEFGGG